MLAVPVDEGFWAVFKDLEVYLGFSISTMALFASAVRYRFSRSGTRQEFQFSKRNRFSEVLGEFRYALLLGV